MTVMCLHASRFCVHISYQCVQVVYVCPAIQLDCKRHCLLSNSFFSRSNWSLPVWQADRFIGVQMGLCNLSRCHEQQGMQL